jgi:PAS domain S-box-containing protein
LTRFEEQLAQVVVERALDAVVITNSQGRIVVWNHQAELLFGWPAEEALGRTITELVIPPERLAPYRATIEAISAGGPGERREGLARDRAGRVFPVEVSLAAIRADDADLVSHFIHDLSEHRAAETTLRETNELLKSLLDGLPLPVNVLDADGCVTLWNKAAEETFGWTADEVAGRQVPTATAEELDGFRQRQRRIFAGETLRDVPVKGRRRDEVIIDFSLSAAPVRGADGSIVGSMGVLLDVTEKNKAAEELRETNALLQALLEAVPLPITLVDLEGRTMVWNPAAAREFGWTADEVLGEPLPIVPPDGLDLWRQRCEQVAAGETLTDVVAHRLHRDGSVSDVSLSVAPVYGPEGSVSGVLGISMNMTERNRAYELLRSGDEERRRLLAKLVRAQEEERQRISSDIHDDSVQVLTALALRLELLRRRLDEPAALADLAEAEQTARLAITRLRHLMFELRPPALDRDGLVAALRMHLEQTKHEFGVDFSIEDVVGFEPEGEVRALVYRIAQEAFVNAAKHANASHLDVRLWSEQGSIVVRIVDDGRGFDLDEEHGGHLGLVFMRERAEMAGGSCRIESELGKGTVVEFAVPLNGTPTSPEAQR